MTTPSTQQFYNDIVTAVVEPRLLDMRRRAAAQAKAKGASQVVIDAILAVPLVAPEGAGVAE